MRVFAYCTEAARKAVKKATGVEPITSPPILADTFNTDLSGYDLLYFRLHGLQIAPAMMFGEDMEGRWSKYPALHTSFLGAVRLKPGATVVIANCYGKESKWPAKFYKAGVAVVVSGPGPNMAAGKSVIGTDLLMRWILLSLRAGLDVNSAIVIARARLAFTLWRTPDRDAMAFDIVGRT